MNSSNHYDILVIGSGPAGQKAAVQGAKAGKRVAVVERDREVGGGLCSYRYDTQQDPQGECAAAGPLSANQHDLGVQA